MLKVWTCAGCSSIIRRRQPWRRCWSLAQVLVAAAVAAGCGLSADHTSGPGDVDARLLPAVEAVPARAGTLPLVEELSGVVRARNQVAIHPEISASVVEVLVRNGDGVVRGQPLVRLDDATQLEQLRQAEAGLLMAEAAAAEARAGEAEVNAQVERTRALASRSLVSDLDLETREAQLAAAKAQVAQAEARVGQAGASVAERRSALARTMVRAPAAGRVGQRAVEVGMVVNPGSSLFLLGDVDDLLVEVPLTQDMLHHIREGTPVEIGTRDLEGGAVRAVVSRISPFLEHSSFSTTAEIDLVRAASGLRPGMFVTVRVLHGESEPATLVPVSAVWDEPQSGASQLFVVEDASDLAEPSSAENEIPGQARRVTVRQVQVLAEGQGQAGVDGVAEGEWVVTLGQHMLHEQMQVEDSDTTMARVRATSWRRVLELQGMQREDLLEGFMAKQRRVARVLGAELPSSAQVVDELLGEERTHDAAPPASSSSGPPAGGR